MLDAASDPPATPSPSMTTAVHVRPATGDDHARIGAILAHGYRDFGPGPYRDYVTDPAQWADRATATLVAVDDGDRVLGVVAFALAGTPLHEPVVPPMGDASFRFLAVAVDARGRGVGQALVRACLDRARDAGARRVAIFTMDFMGAAQHLYAGLGFRRRPDLDVEFPGGAGLALTHDLAADAAAHFAPPGPVPSSRPWYEDVFAPDPATST